MLTKSEIQHVKSLRTKKFRQKYNQFIVEGEKAIAELLQSEIKVETIYGIDNWLQNNLPLIKGLDSKTITEKELERISGFEQPNKVLAIAVQPQNKLGDAVFKESVTIALDFIQDPGNLGTIIRTADWYGIKNIICSTNCVDMYSPKVINATMGSFARVKVFYANLYEALLPHKENVFACVINGDSIYDVEENKNAIILIGNEGKGISDELIDIAGKKISIPKRGGAESLNAAVATAIIVDQMVRKHP